MAILCFRKVLGSKKFMPRRGYQVFLSVIFCLTVAKKVVEETFCNSENFCSRKNFWIWAEVITIFRWNFQSLSMENFRRGRFLCFRFFPVSINLTPTRLLSIFPVGDFLSHSNKKLRRRTLLCFRKFPVSTNFMHRRGKSRFCVGTILPPTIKKLSRWPFCVSEKFCHPKTFCIGGGYWVFRRIFSVKLWRKRS